MFCSDGNENNRTEEQNITKLNSNPTNCDDIKKLGYTLNGYYLVNDSNIDGLFSVVFCQFKLPPGAKKGMVNFFFK